MCLDTRLTKMSVALAALFGAQAVQSSSSPKRAPYSFFGAAAGGIVDDDQKRDSPESDDGSVDDAAADGMNPAHPISHAKEIPQRGLPRPQRVRGLPRPERVELEAPEFFNSPDILGLHAKETDRVKREAMYATITKQPNGIIAMNISSPMSRIEATEAECAHKMSKYAKRTKGLSSPAQTAHSRRQMNGHVQSHVPAENTEPVQEVDIGKWMDILEQHKLRINMTLRDNKENNLRKIFPIVDTDGRKRTLVFRGWQTLNPSSKKDKTLYFTLLDKNNPSEELLVFTTHKHKSKLGSKQNSLDIVYHNGFCESVTFSHKDHKKWMSRFINLYIAEGIHELRMRVLRPKPIGKKDV